MLSSRSTKSKINFFFGSYTYDLLDFRDVLLSHFLACYGCIDLQFPATILVSRNVSKNWSCNSIILPGILLQINI